MHRIRLREPWQCEAACEAVQWRRRFGRPGGLEPGEQVWLVVEGIAWPGTVVLNDQPLGPLPGSRDAARFDVTARLLPRNELVLRLEVPESWRSDAAMPGNVRLEIDNPENDRPNDRPGV